jgi:hypothetical protein
MSAARLRSAQATQGVTHGLTWCPVGSIGHDEIENAITVELSYDHGNRIGPEGAIAGLLEGAVAITPTRG